MLIKLLYINILVFILTFNSLLGDKLDEEIDTEPNELVSLINTLKYLGFKTKCIDICLDNCNHIFNTQNTTKDKLDLDDDGLLPFFKSNPNCFLKKDKFEEAKIKINQIFRPQNCLDILYSGDKISGIKVIFPWKNYPEFAERVYCDQETDEGGWTVIQRRKVMAIREDFYRTWIEYRLGFGNKESEFWLGNDLINELTSSRLHQLRIDLMDFDNETRWAKYQYFRVDDLNNNYKLSIDRYSGTAGDAMKYHNNQMFSTLDRDNDKSRKNCAITRKGAWWYAYCTDSNLNGYPYEGKHSSYADGINWYQWRGSNYSMASTTMMIKPIF